MIFIQLCLIFTALASLPKQRIIDSLRIMDNPNISPDKGRQRGV
ncbi:MAG: hypothetical protein PHW01_01075 [Patescibacteria group bacterium]|nr:hypothetical protein [Patescibacteria group bacterium]